MFLGVSGLYLCGMLIAWMVFSTIFCYLVFCSFMFWVMSMLGSVGVSFVFCFAFFVRLLCFVCLSALIIV